jgi:hypothetical protein
VIRGRFGIGLVAVLTLLAGDAAAQTAGHEADEPSVALLPGEWRNPMRGSSFYFEQSLSTQAAHLETSPEQSYVPFYGWWFSLRPRWNFNDKLRVQARLDYYKELTNSQTTTQYREDVFDDIWTDLVYATPVATSGPWSHTKVTGLVRAQWPTSKQSQGAGVYVTLGALAGVKQTIPLGGGLFGSAWVDLRFRYLHPFSDSTTPTNYNDFAYVRENVDGFSFVSHQLTGQTLVANELTSLAEAGVKITPKLSLSVDVIWIDQWHYSVPPGTVAAGPTYATVPGTGQQFTQLIWEVASLEYEVLDELSLGLGYYNLTNVIAPDGTVRSPFAGGEDNAFWSPDARIFLTATANLDKIYEDVSAGIRSRERAPLPSTEAARAERGPGDGH